MSELQALMLRPAESLPWVSVAEGAEIRVPHADLAADMFVLNSRVAPGYASGRHLHTGEVWVITLSGGWKYAEHPEVNTAGSYLYEPAGSAHTLNALPDAGPTEFWAVVRGALVYLDEQNNELSRLDAAGARAMYLAGCAAANLPTPDIL